jgi:hypothetical protein
VGPRLQRFGDSADSGHVAQSGCSGSAGSAQQRAAGRVNPKEIIVLYTVVVVLLVLWVLGLVTSFTAGGLLHLLLVAAVVVLVYQLITGRRGV